MSGFVRRRTAFSGIEGWARDDMRAAFAAFRRSALRALEIKPCRRGAAGAGHQEFLPAYRQARELDPERLTEAQARHFFETCFEPWSIAPPQSGAGQVTAFYEPVVRVAPSPDGTFRHPFLRKPQRLTKVENPDSSPAGIPPGFGFYLDTEDGPAICPDRGAIERGVFAGQGLEIAWAADKADVFFAHVQGSARLDFGDGEVLRITYAGKSGHPFTGIGRLLVARGEIPQDEISMQSIRRWLASRPEQADTLMRENRSYIFFVEAPVEDDRLGPIAAAGVPLEPGRSMAVDRQLHTLGTPFFVTARSLADFYGDGHFARLMIAQDTGSAIVGPARGDLFTGSGDRAGELAGAVNAVADFVMLMPRGWLPDQD